MEKERFMTTEFYLYYLSLFGKLPIFNGSRYLSLIFTLHAFTFLNSQVFAEWNIYLQWLNST